MKTSKLLKLSALLLAMIFLAISVTSNITIILCSDHDHAGDTCVSCVLLRKAEEFARKLNFLYTAASFSVPQAAIAIIFTGLLSLQLQSNTPISLRDRKNN